MATVRKWANVSVAMQSALASPVTITAATKANPVVCTATNTYTNGDFVLLSVQGMSQLDNKVVRVSAASGSGFTCEGIDGTGFDTFSSGTASKITFGTTINSAVSMSASGGTFDFIDTTTIHSAVKSQIPGLAEPLTYSFDNLWDLSDAAQIAMKTASDSQAVRAFKIVFGTGGPIVLFAGYVGFTGAPTGNALDKVTTPAVITAFGSLTSYSS